VSTTIGVPQFGQKLTSVFDADAVSGDCTFCSDVAKGSFMVKKAIVSVTKPDNTITTL
jgi:hypothetical protein